MSCPDCARKDRSVRALQTALAREGAKVEHQSALSSQRRAEHRATAAQWAAARTEWADARAKLEAERDAACTELRSYRVWLAHAQDRATTLQRQLDAAAAELVRLRRARTSTREP
jgi:predicted  nucleic acid-binding Zn-ribbon protein